jgi:hypothetical protein
LTSASFALPANNLLESTFWLNPSEGFTLPNNGGFYGVPAVYPNIFDYG